MARTLKSLCSTKKEYPSAVEVPPEAFDMSPAEEPDAECKLIIGATNGGMHEEQCRPISWTDFLFVHTEGTNTPLWFAV